MFFPKLSCPLIATAILMVPAVAAHAAPVLFQSVATTASVTPSSGGTINANNSIPAATDPSERSESQIPRPDEYEPSAYAFQEANGSSGIVIDATNMAAGGQSQVKASASTFALHTFTADAASATFDFRVSGIQLFVDGDHGGTSGAVISPFDTPSAQTVGASFDYFVYLFDLATNVRTDLFEAGLEVFGRGALDNPEVAREYRVTDVRDLTYSRTDICGQYGCDGVRIDVNAIDRSLDLGPLEIGRDYLILVQMQGKTAGYSYENGASVRAFDPSNLSSYALTSGPTPPVSQVPLPASALLLGGALGGFALVGARRRRTVRRQDARTPGR